MTLAESQARNVVIAQLHCRRCGYCLYGLPADGKCPECGLETWQTILHTVDPAASRLPRLHNPRAVGDGLLWLLACLVVVAGLLSLRPLAGWLDSLDARGLRALADRVPAAVGWLAPLVALGGLWGVWRMAPSGERARGEAVRRDLWLITAGLALGALGLAGLAAAQPIAGWSPVPDALRLGLTLPAAAGLLGLGGVLRVIGLRSREYRTARGGRQGIQAMIAATAGVALGAVLRLAGGLMAQEGQVVSVGGGVVYLDRALTVSGTVVMAISALMLLIGLAYLTVNVWWIRRALRRPPPALGELLGAEPPG